MAPTTFGWDASHWDWDRGPMDVAAAKADGISFVTHKITEGTGYTDPRFPEFLRRARAAGVPMIGGYCVNRAGDQRPQVDHYIRQLDQYIPWWRDGAWIPQLDAERWSYAPEPSPADIRAWCDYFMQRTGGRWRPVVYAPRWVYGDRLAGLPYPLWASSYGSDPAVHYRSAYPGDGSSRWAAYSGKAPAVLQFGSRTIIGRQGTCDANAYRGTIDQLRSLITGEETDMTPEQDLRLKRVELTLGSQIQGLNETVDQPYEGGVSRRYPIIPNQQLKQLIADVAELKSRPLVQPAPVDPATLKAVLLDPDVLQAIARAVIDEDHRRSAS